MMHRANTGRIGSRRKEITFIAAAAVVLAALEVLSIASAVGLAGTPSLASGAPAPAHSALAPGGIGAPELAAAERSLEQTGSTISGPLAATSPSWSEEPTALPEPRESASMVYDAKDKYVLLFGGYGPTNSGGFLSDTWTYANGVWTELSPSVAPSARSFAAIAYDAKDGYVVLYGGESTTTLSDTWKFVGGVWTQLSPTKNPGALEGASMVYDAKDGYVLLLGSVLKNGVETSVTWTFKGGQWRQPAVTGAPGARNFAAMDYDAGDGYVLLFGGDNSTKFVAMGDTWKYSNDTWTQLTPAVAPPARYFAGMADDVIGHQVVLFSGYSAAGADLSDTWTFAAGTWTKISTAFHPSKRQSFAFADGSATTDALLFGGDNAGGPIFGDNWTFTGDVWAHPVPRSPTPRSDAAITYDEKDRYVLLFGGEATATGVVLADTWKFANGAWTELHPTVAPPARFAAAMAYDPADGYVVLWGGQNASTQFNDTWTFVGGQWSLLDVGEGAASAPPPASESSMAYDAVDGYLVLFGGSTCPQYCATFYFEQYTWEFAAGLWTNVTPRILSAANSPPRTAGAEMTFDSEDGYLLLFDGIQEFGIVIVTEDAATWSFSNGAWKNLTSSTTGAPPPVSFGGLVDDTYDGYPVLWGGYDFHTSTSEDETWEYTGTAWTELSPVVSPPAGSYFAMAFDPPLDSVVAVTTSGPTWTY
jgi:Kelch motif